MKKLKNQFGISFNSSSDNSDSKARKEAVVQMCSVKKVFLEISKNEFCEISKNTFLTEHFW